MALFFLYIYILKSAMKKNITSTALVLFLLISVYGTAQSMMPAASGGVPPPPPPPVPPPGLPIDNGIIVLIVLGLIYGVYKLVSKGKASNV